MINNGAEPEETPAHNKMQLLFLDERICRAVATLSRSVLPKIDLPDGATLYAANIQYEHGGIDVTFNAAYRYKVKNGETYKELVFDITTFNLELKPSLGDDYPAVLRQVLTACRRREGQGVVVCDAWTAVGGTFDQVHELFKRSGVILLRLEDVQIWAETLSKNPS